MLGTCPLQVHRGELLTDDGAVLQDLCQEGSSLVLLPSRAVGPRPAPCTAPVSYCSYFWSSYAAPSPPSANST